MDECKGLIVCKNRIKYRTGVAISAEYMKDVSHLAWKTCGFEIDILKKAQAWICHKMSHIWASIHENDPSYIWDSSHKKDPSLYIYIYICYKNDSHLNRYNF